MKRRRSPHGERGLKYKIQSLDTRADRSLPTRGAWIEISNRLNSLRTNRSRSPHGERGLKFPPLLGLPLPKSRRSPHGERGLKFWPVSFRFAPTTVAPHTGSVD